MNENTFRTLCAAAMAFMFCLIIWMIVQDRNQKKGIQIKSPWFEYEGKEINTKQDIHIESPWFEYKGEHTRPK